MFVSVTVGYVFTICVLACIVLAYRRMSELDPAVSEVLVRECAALLQEFSIHA